MLVATTVKNNHKNWKKRLFEQRPVEIGLLFSFIIHIHHRQIVVVVVKMSLYKTMQALHDGTNTTTLSRLFRTKTYIVWD
jgi:hypothetical protein